MPEWLKGEYMPLLLDAAKGFAYSSGRILLVLFGGWVAVRLLRASIKRMEDTLVRERRARESPRSPASCRRWEPSSCGR